MKKSVTFMALVLCACILTACMGKNSATVTSDVLNTSDNLEINSSDDAEVSDKEIEDDSITSSTNNPDSSGLSSDNDSATGETQRPAPQNPPSTVSDPEPSSPPHTPSPPSTPDPTPDPTPNPTPVPTPDPTPTPTPDPTPVPTPPPVVTANPQNCISLAIAQLSGSMNHVDGISSGLGSYTYRLNSTLSESAIAGDIVGSLLYEKSMGMTYFDVKFSHQDGSYYVFILYRA